MLKANARKRRHITTLSRGQRGGNILKKQSTRIVKDILKKNIPTIESKLQDVGVNAEVIKLLKKELTKQLGGGIIKDALVRLYAFIMDKDPYEVGRDKKETEEWEKEHFREAREGERERQRKIKEAKERDLQKKRDLYKKLKGGCATCDEIMGSGLFDFLSKKVINPAVRKFSKTMVSHKFGDRYAEAIDKALERQFKENPNFALQRLTSKDFWEKSFKTTHEFLKNDKTLKKFKKPIGDALNAIPVVGSEMKTGWEKLTKDEGKAKETDLAEDLNKSVRKIKAQEKLFKKYGISPPPIAIGYASAEGYKKVLDEYLQKNKTQLMKMAQDTMSGGSYWSCANAPPSCKKLYRGMKEYHACAVKKNCRNREIRRAEAEERFAEIDRPRRAVSSATSGTQTELPLNQPRPRARRQPRRQAPVSQGSQDIRSFFG